MTRHLIVGLTIFSSSSVRRYQSFKKEHVLVTPANKEESMPREMVQSSKIDREGMPHNSLDRYLREIGDTRFLTREEETELSERIRDGDIDAQHRLVRANLRFVVATAKRYMNQGLSLSDLIGEGNLGIIRAAHRFDGKRGCKFISYAVWWIRQAILQALAENSRIVRVPLNRAGTLHRIGQAKKIIDQKINGFSTPAQIAAALKISEEEVLYTQSLAEHHISLDDPGSTDELGRHLIELIKDERSELPDTLCFQQAKKEDFAKAMSTLSDRERVILTLYYGLNGEPSLTLVQVGSRVGVTRERVRQIRNKALKRLRKPERAKYLVGHL